MTDLRRDIWHGIVLLAVLAGLLDPMFRSLIPYAYYAPDVGYVIAKVHAVGLGRWFADPVSGTNTFHPAGYHLILYSLTSLGLSLKSLLFAACIFIYAGLLGMGYLTIRRIYSPTVALLAAVTSPFVILYMLDIRLLIPSSWNVSITFYLFGLWLALGPRTQLRAIAVGLIWAVTLMISPVNIFIVGLYVLYELIKQRDRYSWILLGVIGLAVLPLSVYQLTTIIRDSGFYRQETFSVVPQVATLLSMPTDFLRGNYVRPLGWPTVLHAVFLLSFAAISWWRRRLLWYVVFLLIVYVFTYLFFSNGYAIRMQPYLNLFVAAGIFDFLLSLRRGKRIGWSVAVLGLCLALWYHTGMMGDVIRDTRSAEQIAQSAEGMTTALAQVAGADEQILCDRKIYRIVIMPTMPLRALSCHGSMSYFQVRYDLARQMEADYLTMTKSSFVEKLQDVVDRYDIRTAVIWRLGELVHSRTIIELLESNWKEVYSDEWFAIYRRK